MQHKSKHNFNMLLSLNLIQFCLIGFKLKIQILNQFKRKSQNLECLLTQNYWHDNYNNQSLIPMLEIAKILKIKHNKFRIITNIPRLLFNAYWERSEAQFLFSTTQFAFVLFLLDYGKNGIFGRLFLSSILHILVGGKCLLFCKLLFFVVKIKATILVHYICAQLSSQLPLTPTNYHQGNLCILGRIGSSWVDLNPIHNINTTYPIVHIICWPIFM